MPVNLRTSLRLNNDLPVSTFVDLAVRAENAGFDQVWGVTRPLPAVRARYYWRGPPWPRVE